ncbi:MAG: heme biosynthesis protein HemY, partial [Chloroflexi bacterium]|nr:heme biosynthesis protein HemY [Chloroflexota bacterium]
MTRSNSYQASGAILAFISFLTLTALACTRSDVPVPAVIGLAAEAAAPEPSEAAPEATQTVEPVPTVAEPTAAPTE